MLPPCDDDDLGAGSDVVKVFICKCCERAISHYFVCYKQGRRGNPNDDALRSGDEP